MKNNKVLSETWNEALCFSMGITSKLQKIIYPTTFITNQMKCFCLECRRSGILADIDIVFFFLGKLGCAMWKCAQNCKFSGNQTRDCVTDGDRKLYPSSQKPQSRLKYIFLLWRSFVIYYFFEKIQQLMECLLYY